MLVHKTPMSGKNDTTALTVPTSTSSLAATPTKPPYAKPAAGVPAVINSFRYAAKTSGLVRGLRVFLDVNQQEGFDCPGCAWPEPAGHRSPFEFCENGARAVAHEADIRVVDAAFFARHSISELRAQTDHQLEHNGRLVEPVIKRPGDTHYRSISWNEAFDVVGSTLRALPSPDRAALYTSGRTSNEAAFLYQLFARAFGTNNLPDCSNMCHESSGRGMGNTIGVGKGTVQLADFDEADCIFVIGQNPGTNHPRMLSTLAAARARGCAIVVVNPIRERGLQQFAHPQQVKGVLGLGDEIASHWAQVKPNGDVALLKGIMKVVVDEDRARGGVLDRAFLDAHVNGLDEFLAALDAVTWDDIVSNSGISRADIETLGHLYARSERVIACWAMGITQHENGVDNVREIINLLLLRGNIGRVGAGACPVRGHSNVQGDRTMGINEEPPEAFLQALDVATGLKSPRHHGVSVVHAIEAFERSELDVFIGMGGNLVAAAPDTPRVDAALQRAKLTVSVATKLNRTHLAPGSTSLILPCLGRTERDVQRTGPQFVTVENSMGVVHRSEGKLPPSSSSLKSEVAIVAGMAQATVGDVAGGPWQRFVDNYDVIRDLVAQVVPGFADFNARVRAPDGFTLVNSAAQRQWRTSTGKAALSVVSLPQWQLLPEQLVLMTIRSHDQYNTTVYDESDRYRGIYNRRDILFVGAADLAARGFVDGDRVDITSHFNGVQRIARHFAVVAHDLPAGCVAGYFPELNVLVPLESRARESHTPTSKAVVVTLARSAAT
jgi:molybdopterin-dependent oxidoreductase alpha subunit